VGFIDVKKIARGRTSHGTVPLDVTCVQQVEPQVSGLAGRGAGLPPHAGATAAPPLLQVQAALLQGPHDPILVVKNSAKEVDEEIRDIFHLHLQRNSRYFPSSSPLWRLMSSSFFVFLTNKIRLPSELAPRHLHVVLGVRFLAKSMLVPSRLFFRKFGGCQTLGK
jgi:hypothetical protein